MTESTNSHQGEKLEKSNSEEVPQQGETVEDADAQSIDSTGTDSNGTEKRGWETPKG